MVLLPHGPEPCASANSAIPACKAYLTIKGGKCQSLFCQAVFVKCLCYLLQILPFYDKITLDFWSKKVMEAR